MSACSFGVLFGEVFEVLVTVRAHFGKIDGRVLGKIRAGDAAGAVLQD